MADKDRGGSVIDQLIEKVGSVGKRAASTASKSGAKAIPYDQRSYAVGDLNTRFGEGYRQQDVVYDIEAGVAAVAPRFREGDEWQFMGRSPREIASIQRMLDAAGLLTGTFSLGVWDAKTAGAMKKVLAHANRSGLTWQAALDQLASGGAALKAQRRGGGGGGGGGRAFVPRLSNPDDLKSIFKQASYTLLGAKSFIDDATLDRMVSAYHQEEIRAQRAAFSGQQTVEAPSPDTFAEQRIEETDPLGAQAARMARYTNVLDSLIGGA